VIRLGKPHSCACRYGLSDPCSSLGTPQARTIATRWHPIFRLRAAVAEPLRITSYVYNGDGTSCGVAADGATLVAGALAVRAYMTGVG